MSFEIQLNKQHERSKFIENSEIFFKRPKKVRILQLKAFDDLPLLTNCNSSRDIIIKKEKRKSNQSPRVVYMRRLMRKKTLRLKESKTFLKLNSVYPLHKNPICNKVDESLIKMTMNSNENIKTEPNKYEMEMNYLKEATDSKGNLVMLNNKYEMKDLKAKIVEMQQKIKLIKGVCDFTCPLVFVARNNLIKLNKKSQISHSPKKCTKLPPIPSCIPTSLIYSMKQ